MSDATAQLPANGPDSTLGLETKSDRRLILKASLASLAAIGATSVTMPASADPMVNDVNILNFALNLEYLEAEYYLRATTGQGLSDADTSSTRTSGGGGTRGTVTGGSQVPFQSSAIAAYAAEIAQDELNHVRFIRSALGDRAVAEPSINFTDTFNALAVAAGLGSSFDPFASDANFLVGAFVFEDVGVTAYHGAAPLITSSGLLGYAAGILAVEAYHAGIIRTLMSQMGLQKYADQISGLRDRLDGNPHNQDQGIQVGGKINLVPADPHSLAFSRTPTEVLGIVYAGGSSGNFGFFPDRVNGAFR